jgi:hypothetical protein
MKSNEGPKIGTFRREVLSKTASLSLRLRFPAALRETLVFGCCSVSVRVPFGSLSGCRPARVRRAGESPKGPHSA